MSERTPIPPDEDLGTDRELAPQALAIAVGLLLLGVLVMGVWS